MKKLFTALSLSIIIALSAFAFAACDTADNGGGATPEPTGEFTLSESAVTFKQIGQFANITAKKGETVVTDVTWTTDKAGVANVANGVIVAVGEGEAKITAKRGEETAEVAVTFAADEFTVGFTNSEVKTVGAYNVVDLKSAAGAGHTLTLAVKTPTPLVKASDGVIYTSTSNAIATVSDAGVITAVAPGLAIITATTKEYRTVAKQAMVPGVGLVTNYVSLPAVGRVVVKVDDAFDEEDHADILGTYETVIDWKGWPNNGPSQMNPDLSAWTAEARGYIRGRINVQIKADGTFTQLVENAPRSGYVWAKKDAPTNAGLTTVEQLKAEYGGGAYPYNPSVNAVTAHTADGKDFIALTGNAMPSGQFKENGVFGIFGGKLVFYFYTAQVDLAETARIKTIESIEDVYTPYNGQGLTYLSLDFKGALTKQLPA